jgi:hypothetical protein
MQPVPLEAETAPIEEVAKAIGRSEVWLRRRWLKLHLEHGFPRKLPQCWAWPRAAVAAWLRAGGASPAQPAPAGNDNAYDDEAAFRAAIATRYGVEP